jgi:hypothetical protein
MKQIQFLILLFFNLSLFAQSYSIKDFSGSWVVDSVYSNERLTYNRLKNEDSTYLNNYYFDVISFKVFNNGLIHYYYMDALVLDSIHFYKHKDKTCLNIKPYGIHSVSLLKNGKGILKNINSLNYNNNETIYISRGKLKPEHYTSKLLNEDGFTAYPLYKNYYNEEYEENDNSSNEKLKKISFTENGYIVYEDNRGKDSVLCLLDTPTMSFNCIMLGERFIGTITSIDDYSLNIKFKSGFFNDTFITFHKNVNNNPNEEVLEVEEESNGYNGNGDYDDYAYYANLQKEILGEWIGNYKNYRKSKYEQELVVDSNLNANFKFYSNHKYILEYNNKVYKGTYNYIPANNFIELKHKKKFYNGTIIIAQDYSEFDYNSYDYRDLKKQLKITFIPIKGDRIETFIFNKAN